MGKSAKLHKRVKKIKSSTSSSTTTNQSAGTSSQAQAQASKKKSNLKKKASKGKSEGREGPVLGGADYVSLLMGGRKKAREEAAKLPKDDDEDMS